VYENAKVFWKALIIVNTINVINDDLFITTDNISINCPYKYTLGSRAFSKSDKLKRREGSGSTGGFFD
jgi:hypothetical protein